jgi:hypothetical protein
MLDHKIKSLVLSIVSNDHAHLRIKIKLQQTKKTVVCVADSQPTVEHLKTGKVREATLQYRLRTQLRQNLFRTCPYTKGQKEAMGRERGFQGGCMFLGGHHFLQAGYHFPSTTVKADFQSSHEALCSSLRVMHEHFHSITMLNS